MSFGQNIQFLRKMHIGMTQEELAEKLGVSRQTISKWEIDASFPEMEKALALCEPFSCSLDELLRGKGIREGWHHLHGHLPGGGVIE